MNYYNYNFICLLTSLIMLFIICFRYNKIDFCYIFILSALFSIIWRSTKLIKGKEKIEENNNNLKHPLFILDFIFALLVYICLIHSKQINYKFIIITFFVFILAWTYHFINQRNISNTIHTTGHFYVILIFILVFYFNIN